MVNTIAPSSAQALKSIETPSVSKNNTTTHNNGFADLVKSAGTEAIEASRASDKAAEAAIAGQISDLELVQVMNEAELSLQRFKTVYETTKQSVDKVLNMNI